MTSLTLWPPLEGPVRALSVAAASSPGVPALLWPQTLVRTMKVERAVPLSSRLIEYDVLGRPNSVTLAVSLICSWPNPKGSCNMERRPV